MSTVENPLFSTGVPRMTLGLKYFWRGELELRDESFIPGGVTVS
jgi:hypothetical protein